MTSMATHTTHIMDQLHDSGVFFNVREEALRTESGLTVPGKKVLINEATNTPLSVVSSRYRTVTNKEIFDSFAYAMQASGSLDLEDAKVDVKFSHGGARTMVDIILPNHEIEVDGDRNQLRITTLNSYDGSWRYTSKAGAVRLACMNGQILGKFAAGYSSTHTPSLDVDSAANSMVDMLVQFNSAKEYWGQMLSRATTEDDVRAVTAQFFGVNIDEGFDKRPQVIKLMTLVNEYQRMMGKTAYALYNALSDYITHREYKDETRAHSVMYHTERFEKVLDTHALFAA